MVRDRVGDLGAFLTLVQTIARDTPPDRFRSAVLTCLQTHISFRRAIWGDALINGRMDLRKPEMFGFATGAQSDAELGAFADPRLSRVLGAPGIAHAYSIGENDPFPLRMRAAEHHIGHIMSIAQFDETLGLASGIVFVRSEDKQAFSPDDTAFIDAAFDHIMRAWTACQIGHLVQSTRAQSPTTFHAAARQGRIIEAVEPGFLTLMQLEWAQWHGPIIPEALIDAKTGMIQAAFTGASIVVRAVMRDDIALVSVRNRMVADTLTFQERRVAILCADGLTYKEIAQRLGLAPTTARNHIAAVHRRLGVSRNSEIGSLLLTGDSRQIHSWMS